MAQKGGSSKLLKAMMHNKMVTKHYLGRSIKTIDYNKLSKKTTFEKFMKTLMYKPKRQSKLQSKKRKLRSI